MAKPEKDGIILKEETPRITGIPSIESINVERKNYIIEKYKHEKIISREIFKLYPDLTEHEIKKAIYDMITWDENCEIEEPLQKNERQSLFITEHKPTDKKIELNITIKNYPEIYDFSIQNLEDLGSTIFPWMPYDLRVFEEVQIEIKYEGYINKQISQIEKMRKLESRRLPDIDYNDVRGLRLEAIEKLNKVKPDNLGQASRISGVSPADISVLIIWLSSRGKANG